MKHVFIKYEDFSESQEQLQLSLSTLNVKKISSYSGLSLAFKSNIQSQDIEDAIDILSTSFIGILSSAQDAFDGTEKIRLLDQGELLWKTQVKIIQEKDVLGEEKEFLHKIRTYHLSFLEKELEKVTHKGFLNPCAENIHICIQIIEKLSTVLEDLELPNKEQMRKRYQAMIQNFREYP